MFRPAYEARYCFGAPYVCNELAGQTVTAGAFAHPAFLKDHHFHDLKSQYRSTALHVHLLTMSSEPLFLSCAEIDHTFPTESRNKAIDILQNAGKPYQLQVFSRVEHGFALRCNLDKPYERKYTWGECLLPSLITRRHRILQRTGKQFLTPDDGRHFVHGH